MPSPPSTGSSLPTVDADQARAALVDTVPRLTDLLRSVTDADRPALGEWTIADVAAHLTIAFETLPVLAARQIPPPIPDFSVFPAMMVEMARAEGERDLTVLADRIEAATAAFLDGPAVTDPDRLRPWIFAGTEVSGTTFVCHLLDEALIHGDDIARAAGRPWTISRAHGALGLSGFALVAMAQLAGPAMLDQRRAAGVHARYQLRIRGGSRVDLVISNGELAIEVPTGRPVDCYLSVDPVAFLLVLWGRRSQWSAIARGQLMAWGRRPWLGLQLRSLVNNP